MRLARPSVRLSVYPSVPYGLGPATSTQIYLSGGGGEILSEGKLTYSQVTFCPGIFLFGGRETSDPEDRRHCRLVTEKAKRL